MTPVQTESVIEFSTWWDVRLENGKLVAHSSRTGRIELDSDNIIVIGQHTWWDPDEWWTPDLNCAYGIALPDEYGIINAAAPGITKLQGALNQRFGCDLGHLPAIWPWWNEERGNDTRILWPQQLRGKPCFSWDKSKDPKYGQVSPEILDLMSRARKVKATGAPPCEVIKSLPTPAPETGPGRLLEKRPTQSRVWNGWPFLVFLATAGAALLGLFANPIHPSNLLYLLLLGLVGGSIFVMELLRYTYLFKRTLRIRDRFGRTRECALSDIVGWRPAWRATLLSLTNGNSINVPKSHVNPTTLIRWIEDLRQQPIPQLGTAAAETQTK